MKPITVLLVDDHQLVRRGFRRILEDDTEIEVVGEANNGMEAIAMAEKHVPNVVVMDLAMPELDGIQATQEIRRRLPKTAVLALSMHADQSYVRNAFEAGARGYLLKNAIEVDLAAAVKLVAAGRSYKSPGLAEHGNDEDSFHLLTQRERQVLQLIAQGKSNKEIAAILNVSVNTVSVHRANLMEALNIHRTAELVMYAIRKGLVSVA